MMRNMCVDLRHYPYFEIEAGSCIEIFIDGESRMVSKPFGTSRLYALVLPDCLSDVDEDKLPF